MKKIKINEKGVTLVAVGVMIFILLIIAGVATYNMDKMNGIIMQAEEIKNDAESKNVTIQSEEISINNELINYITK